jgi:hypothetical protein
MLSSSSSSSFGSGTGSGGVVGGNSNGAASFWASAPAMIDYGNGGSGSLLAPGHHPHHAHHTPSTSNASYYSALDYPLFCTPAGLQLVRHNRC